MNSLSQNFDVCLSRFPVLTPIRWNDLPKLQELIASVNSADPFARSPGYFAMTGRNGLWRYSDKNTSMLIARHPNRADELLFFPPFGENPADLLESALRHPLIPQPDVWTFICGQLRHLGCSS